MPQLHINTHLVDVDLIIFDKDGTLIDFEYLWAQRVMMAVENLVKQVGGQNWLREALYQALGYDPTSQYFKKDGLLTTTTTNILCHVVQNVLQQQGFRQPDAEELIHTSFAPKITTPPRPDLIRPLGDIKQLFAHLQAANIKIAVMTHDRRDTAEKMLDVLNVRTQVDYLTSQDDEDDGYSAKLHYEVLGHICRVLGVLPRRTMLVGDTVADMVAARRAQFAYAVAVRSGIGHPVGLKAQADFVINNVDKLQPSLHQLDSFPFHLAQLELA